MGYLLAIDPGNTMSAYVLMDGYHIVSAHKEANEDVLTAIPDIWHSSINPGGRTEIVIEMVESYGMAVGREVFETCVWIGRFCQAAISMGYDVDFVTRKAVKLNLCGNPRAKDANVRQALVDRFAQHDLKNGKGTKKNHDWFYGFAADMWAAYAVGVTWLDSRDGGRA